MKIIDRIPLLVAILLLVISLLMLAKVSEGGQTTVYTNRNGFIVKEERQTKPVAAVPPSIQRRADELRVLFELRTRTPVVPPQRVAMPTVVPSPAVATPPMAPLFIDGLYVGSSPSGMWTAVTTKIPTIRVIR